MNDDTKIFNFINLQNLMIEYLPKQKKTYLNAVTWMRALHPALLIKFF